MFRARIKSQLNTSFILSLVLTIVSILTANALVGIVSKSYEDLIDNTLPVMKQNTNLAVLSKDMLVQLEHLPINKEDASIVKNIDKIIILWSKIEHLGLNILKEELPAETRTLIEKKLAHISLYKNFTPQFKRQVLLKKQADKINFQLNNTLKELSEFNQEILLKEMEVFASQFVYSETSSNQKSEVKYAYQFYKNSTKFIQLLNQANISNDVKEINELKIKTVDLFFSMKASGKAHYKYKKYAELWLDKVKNVFSGQNSIFKVRYDAIRLESVLQNIIEQQRKTVLDIEAITDSLNIELQSLMEFKKQETISSVSTINYVFLLLIILSMSLSFISIWLFVNKSLLIRLTKIRKKIIKLSTGDVDIEIEVHKNDELGDMEDALSELKLYVEKAKQLSTRDSLTRLLNHAQFKHNLTSEIKRNARLNISISLAIIDIDYFKDYNDTHGHPEGDKCLKQISQLIENTFKRTGDSCYRIGGEEFAVLMVNANSDIHKVKMQELQNALKETAIQHLKSKVSELLTISVGIYSAIPTIADAAEDFYSKADIALYEAKSKRNTIVVYL